MNEDLIEFKIAFSIRELFLSFVVKCSSEWIGLLRLSLPPSLLHTRTHTGYFQLKTSLDIFLFGKNKR